MLQLLDSFPCVAGLCFLGMVVCAYAINIETSAKGQRKVIRRCDVNKNMSCTLVLTSRYSHMAKVIFKLRDDSMFNYSNAQYGFVFYLAMLVWQFYPFTLLPGHALIFLLMTSASVLGSCGLAYILYAILHNLCLICVCMYVINGLLFTSSLLHIFA